MTDEKYVFISDVRDKKRTARGSFNMRTHAGKGGAVKFPSDYLTKKELRAMNGETKTYNINAPMDWKEFKSMPDDIEAMYIKALRERYGVMNINIAEMLGVHPVTFAKEINRLGFSGQGKGNRRSNFDSEGWCKWLNGIRDPKEEIPVEEPVEEPVVDVAEDVCEPMEVCEVEPVRIAVPKTGQMLFEGDARSVAKAIEQILQDSKVKITVRWEMMPEGGASDGRCQMDQDSHGCL